MTFRDFRVSWHRVWGKIPESGEPTLYFLAPKEELLAWFRCALKIKRDTIFPQVPDPKQMVHNMAVP